MALVIFFEKIRDDPDKKETLSKGVRLPYYIGYLVVDAQYKYHFVDKSGGLANAIGDLASNLNGMGLEETVSNHLGTFPRWSFRGFRASVEQFSSLGFIDNYYKTMGQPPNDSYLLREEDTTLLDFGESADFSKAYFLYSKSLSAHPPIPLTVISKD